MSEPKYKHFYQLMRERHAELFNQFLPIHQGFSLKPDQWAAEFHAKGRDVLDVIRDWERRLCYGTEKGKYAQYSAKLSEKFWAEVKKDFPLVDQIGLFKKS